MIKKNIKGYLKDKYIKNTNRFWDIDFLKREITPNRKYIVKNNILYYIEEKHTEKMTKATIINNYGLGYFISQITKKYLQPSKWYFWHQDLNIDRVLRQLNEGLMTSLKIKDKLLNSKFFVYNDFCLFTKKDPDSKVELKVLIDRYNLTDSDILSILKWDSLRKKLNTVKILCSDEIKVKVWKLIEDYVDFTITIHTKKYLEVFTREESKLLEQYLDFSRLPENEELTNTQILKCFNKSKSLVSIESKVKHGWMSTAPRWYRKQENKRLINKSYREVEYNIKNWDYDLVTAKAIRYVKNWSWYF